jgi:hypothetical protein
LSQVGFQASNIEIESPSANDSTKIHTWGDGRFHLLPQDYELPKTDIFHGWILWSVGDEQSNIPPLRKLTKHDCGSRKLQQTLSDWRLVFTNLLNELSKKKNQMFTEDILLL